MRPNELAELEKEIERLSTEKINLVNSQDYEQAAAVRDKVRQLRGKVDELKQEWESSIRSEENVIDADDIQHIVSDMTGVPLVAHRPERERKAASTSKRSCTKRSSRRTRRSPSSRRPSAARAPA